MKSYEFIKLSDQLFGPWIPGQTPEYFKSISVALNKSLIQ